MALTLPDWLVGAMSFLGYDFPRSNEDVLHAWADHLTSLDHTMDAAHADLLAAIAHVHEHNAGPGAEAFAAYVSYPDSDADALVRFSEGCEIASLGCDICAYLVVVVKGVVLFQLALLAPAIAAGPVSFCIKKAVEWAINQAISLSIAKLLA